MSKSLKKLIDINRLREFKNKLVGTDSVYVQTGAVDQTVGGTKTFPKPIVGSVTGSSGSCTGNAATATTAATAKSCTGNAATATKATGNANGKELTNTIIKGLAISGKTITYTQIDGTTGTLTTQDTNTDTLMTQNVSTTNSTYPILLCPTANATANQGAKTGIFAKSVKVNPSTNVISASGFSGPLTGNVTGNCSGSSGSCTGNAATATKLAAKRTIALSGAATGTATNFDGSGNITIPVTALAASAIRDHILSMVYPVGSVYISVNDVSPEKFLGGTWVKISQGRVLQGASGTQTAGTEVSAGLPNISVSSNGAHTHTRGSMNITGGIAMHGAGAGCTVIRDMNGAFYGSGTESAYHGLNCVSGNYSQSFINFSADRTWTGSTSSDGAHSHDAYITDITGKSTTVQPPALLVNIWKRTA